MKPSPAGLTSRLVASARVVMDWSGKIIPSLGVGCSWANAPSGNASSTLSPTQIAAPQLGAARRQALGMKAIFRRSEEHTSELQSRPHLVCRLLLEKKKSKNKTT